MLLRPTNAHMVHEFMTTYGQDTTGKEAAKDLPAFKDFRRTLVDEEQDEMDEAGDDVVAMFDAGLDGLYFQYGTMIGLGFTPAQINAGLEEVHRSNMSKLGDDGLPIRREDGKVLKGPNYFKPDLVAVLAHN